MTKSCAKGLLATLALIGVFAMGIFLAVAAEDMPAPGLILMTLSGGSLLGRWLGGAPAPHPTAAREDDAFAVMEKARESHQYDVERRQRGDFDMDPYRDTHDSRF